MMSLSLLVRSVLIGFSIAAPVGPIGILVIRRTLNEGRLMGLVTGLGAAAADACYGAVGALGLTVVANWLVTGESWLRLAGGLFLCWLGVRTFIAPPPPSAEPVSGATGAAAFATTFVLTLTNPLTLLSFAAIFAGLGFGTDGSSAFTAMTIVSGVFLGSISWWLLLSAAVSQLRGRLGPGSLMWVNRLSGAVITLFGVVALIGI